MIPDMIAAKVVPSGDIRITLGNPTQKEKAIRMPGELKQRLGLKIVRKDLPVEVAYGYAASTKFTDAEVFIKQRCSRIGVGEEETA